MEASKQSNKGLTTFGGRGVSLAPSAQRSVSEKFCYQARRRVSSCQGERGQEEGSSTGGGGQEEDEEEDEKEARRTKDGASALAFSCAKGGDASVSRERRSGRVGNLARI